MSDLLERVEKSILSRRLFRRGQAVLVAVSGGLDSMVLLHLLARLADAHSWRLAVAHFNHRLRGRSSDADERLVRRTAEKLGLPFISDGGNVREHSGAQGISVEMAARKLRHDFLARTAVKKKIGVIALAHHADDQVELFFLRLLRGAGGEGLGGMKWQSPSPSNPKITLARPLLECPKAALLAWARAEKIPFREDATNAHLDIQRNRIRHEFIPRLAKKYQPALARVVLRQMDILGAEADFVSECARRWLKAKRRPAFASLPVALQRRCLQIQLAENKVRPNFELIEQIRETANRIVAVNETLSVSRDEAGRVQLLAAVRPGFDDRQIEVHLRDEVGRVMFGRMRLDWKLQPVDSGIFRAPKRQMHCELFDAGKVGSPVTLRHWRPGDRFQPIGMSAPVKLQDLFINAKIPQTRRHEAVLAATARGEIFWVEGLRMAERFKLDKNTTRQLKWRWKRL